MTTAAETTAAQTPDEFDKAFDEAIKAESAPAKTEPAATTAAPAKIEPTATTAAPATTEPATTTAAPAKTEPAATTAAPATTEPATTTAAPAKTEPAATTAASAATTTVAPDPRVLAEEAARKIAEEAAEELAAAKKAKDDAAALEIKDPVLTEDQVKVLDSFKKEWPDVAAALDVKAAHDMALVETKFARALTAIVQKVYADIAPVAASAQNVEAGQFRTEVLKTHPDWDTHFPNLEGWIAKQPGYLTEAYKRVYNEGNVSEVNDLMTRFKEANGIGAQAPGTTAAPGKPSETTPSQKQPSAAAKTAASELAPVASQRSIPAPSGADMNDFDGAFAEAAAAEAAHR